MMMRKQLKCPRCKVLCKEEDLSPSPAAYIRPRLISNPETEQEEYSYVHTRKRVCMNCVRELGYTIDTKQPEDEALIKYWNRQLYWSFRREKYKEV